MQNVLRRYSRSLSTDRMLIAESVIHRFSNGAHRRIERTSILVNSGVRHFNLRAELSFPGLNCNLTSAAYSLPSASGDLIGRKSKKSKLRMALV